tara:strand:- start:1456 stop:2667 length:1212 start_codon:yes stop_codon:yes gene_type:complete
MKRDISELRLGVGTSSDVAPDVSPDQYKYYSGYSGSALGNADSNFSRYSNSLKATVEEEEEEDEMESIILDTRVYRAGKYQLCETLDNIEMLDESILDTVKDVASAFTQSTGLAIPGLDTLLGSALVIKYADDAYDTWKLLSKVRLAVVGAKAARFSGTLLTKSLLGSDADFNEALSGIEQLDNKSKDSLVDGLHSFLKVFKELMLVFVQAYDSIPALVGLAAGGIGVALSEFATNITSAVLGFIGSAVPFEKWLFNLISARSGLIAKFVDFVVALQNIAVKPIKGVLNFLPEMIKKGLDKLAAANPLLNGLIFKPEETLRRIGDVYRAAKKKNVSESYSLLELYEDDEEEDEEVEEAITMAGGNIQGYTGPLGREKEKNIKEQIEWMRRLELYHKKTTQRLK